MNFTYTSAAGLVLLLTYQHMMIILYLFKAGTSIIYKSVMIDELAPAITLGLSILSVIDTEISSDNNTVIDINVENLVLMMFFDVVIDDCQNYLECL